MIKMDPRVLVDSFEYLEFESVDRYNKPTFKSSVVVSNTRIDRTTVYSRDTADKKITANAVIFCYAGFTVNFMDFKEQSKVVFDGREHIIQKVIKVTQPYTSDVFAYELEVI